MFLISTKGIYGLSAIFELALNYHNSHIQIREIAETHSIPQHYLEQLLIILKKAGFITSFRGKFGGYTLAKSPDKIKVIDVLKCMEGELEIIGDSNKNNALNFFWDSLKNNIKEKLNITLDELITDKQKIDKHFIFNI